MFSGHSVPICTNGDYFGTDLSAQMWKMSYKNDTIVTSSTISPASRLSDPEGKKLTARSVLNLLRAEMAIIPNGTDHSISHHHPFFNKSDNSGWYLSRSYELYSLEHICYTNLSDYANLILWLMLHDSNI